MCGRFTMTRRDKAELAALLGVPESELGDYTPRFNIAPTQPYFVLRTKYESREVIPATWGLVNSWAKYAGRASMCINAKAETVDTSPTFRKAFEKRRCVVPADGFYAWRGPTANHYGFIQGTVTFFSLPGSSKLGRPSLVNGRLRLRS